MDITRAILYKPWSAHRRSARAGFLVAEEGGGNTVKIDAGIRLLMIGDSITDCGRVRPVGEAPAGLGGGYVNIVNALLCAVCPERAVRVINTGIGGNTVRDLVGRWQEDCLDLHPDWLSIMIGINDVWRRFDHPLKPERHVPVDEYERTLDDLVGRTLPSLKGLVLMTPYYIEPNTADPMRAMMDSYGAVVRKLAEKHGAVLVDTQAAFDDVLRHTYPGAIAGDRVHPNTVGHVILARAFLNAIGFPW